VRVVSPVATRLMCAPTTPVSVRLRRWKVTHRKLIYNTAQHRRNTARASKQTKLTNAKDRELDHVLNRHVVYYAVFFLVANFGLQHFI
jgi:hypothetical protein